MDSLRERKIRTENGLNGSKLPRVDLQRQQQVGYRLRLFLMKNYLLIGLLALLSLLAYGYFAAYSINRIFFKYGHPKDKAWKENDLLTKVQLIDIKLHGPEAITFGANGSLYTGLSNGIIVRVDTDGHVEKIVQIGEELDERVCGNLFKKEKKFLYLNKK